MYKAHHDLNAAGFGHRHRAERAARNATVAVHEAVARVRAICDDGRDVKAHLDHTLSRADQLRRLATPPSWSPDDHLLDRLDHLVIAIETWHEWNTGQPVTRDALIDSLHTLTNEAAHAPAYTSHASEITSSQLDQLAEPLADWLAERGLIQPDRSVEQHFERDTGLGLDL